MIIRKKILEKIDFSKQKVVTIVAPAGYGKSSLIDQIINGSSLKVARVDIDTLNYSIVDVVLMLIGELRSLTDEFIELRSRITKVDKSRLDLAAILRYLVNILNKLDSDNIIIVIEDLHELRDLKEATAVIDVLIKRTHSNVKFVISSREKIQMSLINLISKNLVTEINEKDLQFSKSEVRELLNKLNNDDTDEDLISQLSYVTEGWPVLVALLCSKYGRRIFQLRFPEIDSIITISHVFDFLVDEAYKKLKSKEIRLLLHIWPFKSIDIYKLGIVLGLNRKQVNKLLNSGLPLRRIADNEFKVHPLFKEMLRRKYFEEYDTTDNHTWEKIKDLALKTSSKRSMIEFYMNIGDFENCERYFSNNFEQLVDMGEVKLVEKVIRYLSSGGADSINLDYYEASLLSHAGKPHEAYQRLRKSLATFLGLTGEDNMDLNLSVCRSVYKMKVIGLKMFEQDIDVDRLIDSIRKTRVVESNNYLLERDLTIQIWNDRALESFEVFSYVKSEYKKLLTRIIGIDKYLENIMLSNLGALNYYVGDYKGDLDLIQDYGPERYFDSKDEMILTHLADSYFILANYPLGLKMAKLSLLQQRVSCDEFRKSLHYATFGLIYSYYRRNMRAEPLLRKTLVWAEEVGDYSIQIDLSHGLIDLYRRNQRTADANILSRSTLIKAKKLNSSFLLYWSLVGHILPHSSSEKMNIGKNFFTRVRSRLSSNFAYIHFKIDYLEAIYANQNKQKNAYELFDNVIRKAKDCLYNHFFIEEGVLHLEMYLDAYERGTEHEYIRSSLTTLGDGIYSELVERFLVLTKNQQELVLDLLLSSESRSSIDALRKVIGMVSGDLKKNIRLHLERKEVASKENKKIKFLTKRETEILTLIASGHKNNELAKDLFISEKTVKTHINRIFFKLGVKDRQDAIRLYKKSYNPRQNDRQQVALH